MDNETQKAVDAAAGSIMVTDAVKLAAMNKADLLKQIEARDGMGRAPIEELESMMRERFPPMVAGRGAYRQAVVAHRDLDATVREALEIMARVVKADHPDDGVVTHPVIELYQQAHRMFHDYINELMHPPAE